MHPASSSERFQRVLLVDDEAGLLDAVRMAFEREGREIVACRTFEDARDRLMNEEFDCLVTDVRLGAFTGLQLAVIARDSIQNGDCRVFGIRRPVLRKEAGRLGAAYLVKPVAADQLLTLVDEC